ncbi:MAG: archease [Thermoplasmata archaeon]|nr:MAG: archease [Thermoplasmata archaeon]
MKTYEIIDHTADIGIKAYGETIEEAFENVAKGMFDIITDNSHIDSIGEYMIELEADDLEQLLVDWLSELLFLSSTYNLVFGFFDVKIGDKKLSAIVRGEEYNLDKHKMGVEIKAVTYHMLEVHTTKPIYVQVLFDI